MILYRPVGLRELERIAASGWKAFPPRFAWQPIFYPVLTREYARSIVRNWNARESEAGFAGFVTEFEVEDDYVARFEVRQLGGGPSFRELWVPAEELADFNRHIVGPIRVVESVYNDGFVGDRDPASDLPRSVVEAAAGAAGGM